LVFVVVVSGELAPNAPLNRVDLASGMTSAKDISAGSCSPWVLVGYGMGVPDGGSEVARPPVVEANKKLLLPLPPWCVSNKFAEMPSIAGAAEFDLAITFAMGGRIPLPPPPLLKMEEVKRGMMPEKLALMCMFCGPGAGAGAGAGAGIDMAEVGVEPGGPDIGSSLYGMGGGGILAGL